MPDVATAEGGRAAGAVAAPGRLELVRAFVNTRDIEAGTDELDSTAGLDRWLAAHRLAAPGFAAPGLAGQARPDLAADPQRADGATMASAGSEATEADLTRARALREGMRAILRAHAGGESGETGSLDGIAAGLTARLAVSGDGRVTAVPDGTGASAGLAAILIAAAEAATLGTWSRLKVCGADDCQWAFYDRSPTRSGHWCSMAVCGSRAKSRAYRRRAAISRARQGRTAVGADGA